MKIKQMRRYTDMPGELLNQKIAGGYLQSLVLKQIILTEERMKEMLIPLILKGTSRELSVANPSLHYMPAPIDPNLPLRLPSHVVPDP